MKNIHWILQRGYILEELAQFNAEFSTEVSVKDMLPQKLQLL